MSLLTFDIDLKIWGKQDGFNYHPLVYHMLDSGYICKNILLTYDKEAISFWAKTIKVSESDFLKLIPFFVSLHDIGKCSVGFLSKSNDLTSPNIFPKYGNKKNDTRDCWHGDFSNAILRKLFQKIKFFNGVRRSLGGHHGSFNSINFDNSVFKEVSSTNGDLLEKQQKNIFDYLVDFWQVQDIKPKLMDDVFYLFLTGLTSFSDWISSAFFKMDNKTDLDKYPLNLDIKSKTILTSLGMSSKHNFKDHSFKNMFGFASLKPMQSQMQNVVDRVNEPSLIILEDVMGEGKTESALYLASKLINKLNHTGMYYALPTQATSNQMYSRLDKFLNDNLNDSDSVHLNLNYSNSNLQEFYNDSLSSIDSIYTLSWFLSNKKNLLSPFGIGTIDQSLMSVLDARYFFIRLFGLHNKVIILDELHSYDTYMSTIIERLIYYLKKMRCSVVVLSATLTRTKITELCSEYSLKPLAIQSYPRLTIANPNMTYSSHIDTGLNKKIDIEILKISNDDSGFENIALQINDSISEGGCAALVCNTISNCQKAYKHIKKNASSDTEIIILHSRYLKKDRSEIEALVLDKFKNQNKRPKKAIVIATQIIEQSLDLDFDIMFTFLCPIDLLLQRSGRVHRHSNFRPKKLKNPKVKVIIGTNNYYFGYDSFVYNKYILNKTYKTIENLESITVPNDIEDLINKVYGEDDSLWGEKCEKELVELKEKLYNKDMNSTAKAESFMISKDVSSVLRNDTSYKQDIENCCDIASTREIKNSSNVIVLFSKNNKFYVDRQFTTPININKKSFKIEEEIKVLLKNSVTITNYHFSRMSKMTKDFIWQENPALRLYRPLILNEVGKASFSYCDISGKLITIKLALDEQIGLEIVK